VLGGVIVKAEDFDLAPHMTYYSISTYTDEIYSAKLSVLLKKIELWRYACPKL